MAVPRPLAWSLAAVLAALLLQSGPVARAQDAQKPPAGEAAEPDLINPDRPGIADGSTVIWPHRFQLEIGLQSEFRSDQGATLRTLYFPTLLRFGFSPAWEGRIETSGYTQTRGVDPIAGVSRTSGYAPLSVGAKFHFQDSAGPRRPSLGTIFRLFVPSGSGDFGSHRFTTDLRLVADWDLTRSGDWSLNPNVGVGYYEDGDGSVFTAALAAVTLNYFNRAKTVNPFVDFGLQAPEVSRGRTALILDTGLAYIVAPNIQLDVSVGTGVLGQTPPHPFWAVGYSQRF